MVNQKTPLNPIQILRDEGISIENIPVDDLKRAWFLYHRAANWAGDHLGIRIAIQLTLTICFTLALMVLMPKAQYVVLTIGMITGFLRILKSYKDECIKIPSQNDYFNWMEQLIRKNEQPY